MKVSDYIVDYLIKHQVTDAFGVPGGVVLELIYAMDARKDELTPHLNYHEQAAGFAACGYAQASGHLGVAYATRGPGFTNLISAIADAYCDSLPVLFITGHSSASLVEGMRVMDDQEMDTVSLVRNITKYAVRIDEESQIEEALATACFEAMRGRKGPVFLDVATSVMRKEIVPNDHIFDEIHYDNILDVCKEIQKSIREAKRPVILVGDGVNQSQVQKEFRCLVEDVRVPVISSRFSHDIMGGSRYYFGYVGSHGIRTANFVMSKADLIVAMGNRMHYPVRSESFGAVTSKARVLRLEIDETEFSREVPNAKNFNTDASEVIRTLNTASSDFGDHSDWLKVCSQLREELKHEDVNSCVESIVSVFKKVPSDAWIVNDVGNNEFYVSRASVLAGLNNRVLYSKSFGALGCGLGKAIGTYYATHQPIVCFVGDQGLQMNIQELQFITQHNLPIVVVLLNNQSSGMIKDRETFAYKGHYVHTTKESGYGNPDFRMISLAYGIEYCTLADLHSLRFLQPLFVEVSVDENLTLSPSLPRGAACQDLYPQLDRSKYEYLNSL